MEELDEEDLPPCEHDFELQDESFDHEFGREEDVFWQCTKCGEERRAEMTSQKARRRLLRS